MSDIQLFTPKDIAKRLQISLRTVQRAVQDGELRATKIGDLVRFTPADVEDYIKRQREKTEKATSAADDDESND